MQKFGLIFFLLFELFSVLNLKAQNNQIEMRVSLNADLNSLYIQQKITYFNSSKDTLNQIFFHDWNNAFSHKNTALGKRFIENYQKKFFFAKEKDRGHTQIQNCIVEGESVHWKRPEKGADFVELTLNKKLLPKDSVIIELRYVVKVPNAKFTSYGFDNGNFNLRYWYLIPAVYKEGLWQMMHHLNMDDLYQNPSDYSVNLQVPDGYSVSSNLAVKKKSDKEYFLQGKAIEDFQLFIARSKEFKTFESENIVLSTNLNGIELNEQVKQDLVVRQLDFLKTNLGDYPQKKIFVNKTSYQKNPLYGMNQLPTIVRPFANTFTWDLRLFKVLSQEYINTSLSSQNRKNTWYRNAVSTYLMMRYVEQFYPEVKLIGNISEIWGVRNYHVSQLDFNKKYSIIFQHIASTNNDQALTTPSDSLTNFNRLVFQKYKGALALRYLDGFLGGSIVPKAIRLHFQNKANDNSQHQLKYYIKGLTDKNTDWFFDDFLNTDKEIDYSLKKITTNKDSIHLLVKNKGNITVPIPIYGIAKNGEVISTKWLPNVQSVQKLVFSNDSISQWEINRNRLLPEVYLGNNFVNKKGLLFRKPLTIRWLTDMDNPKKNQLFIEPKTDYNLYDGIILATSVKNENSLHKNITYSLTPAYSLRSKSVTGSGKLVFHKYIENKIINSYRLGVGGSYFHYQPNLAYKKFITYAQLSFRRKNLRSVKSSSLSMGLTVLDKDSNGSISDTYNKYQVFRMSYNFKNPELIDNFSHSTSVEIGEKFSKVYADIRYRKLTNHNQQFGIRFFAGAFLYNNTVGDFFSYGVNRPNDYLFRYGYFGRAETKGLFSQQIIINDGGFKSQIPVAYANQWITSINTSIGIWRWFEIYNDVGLIKNTNKKVFFAHDKGVRLNFVNDIFEIYFPVHSNNGWEITLPHYEKRIRFVFKADFSSIYNFAKRGFL